MTCERVRLELPAIAASDGHADPKVLSHLSTCSACQTELAETRETLATARRFGTSVPEGSKLAVLAAIERTRLSSALSLAVEPPDRSVKRAVMTAAREDLEKNAAPSKVTDIRSRRPRLALALGAAAALLIVGVGIGSAIGGGETPAPEIEGPRMPEGHETQIVALLGMGPNELEVRHYRHDNFRLTLSVEGFEPTPPGFHYAVWVRGADGDVAIGTFRLQRPDDFDIPFAMGVNPTDYPDLAITLEPNDGDPKLDGDIVSNGTFDLDTVHHGTYDD